MNFIWHSFFFDPIYNSLVFFIDIIPGGDVGIAIIFTVILVKTIILPVSLKAARTQFAMQELEPKLTKIKEDFKDKRELQAVKTMELFKEAKVNPFSSILLLFIQIPIVLALYFSVSRGGGTLLPAINTDLLYSFIPTPETVNMIFLGIMDITQKSMPLALLAGVTQYIHTKLSLPPRKARDPKAEPNFKDDFAHSMQMQMRYVMPVIIIVVAYTISAAIALYFTISNLMAIAQEYVVRHKGLKLPIQK
ncbi:MAG: YidC/Oxa1 family membrane protein insertase [Candidatus Pacebacteria bacterium]|nr:YidC/Oxa1 family membrane protein insertase [Candidatus Paceibacterota bacterium]MCF7857315.1 YidC/Oxa1 family membrane protein insertase [Candidatus Paceibacterota bacterium]